MKTIKLQYITNAQGKRVSVILPMQQWQQVLDQLEEIEDIRLYNQVKANQEPTTPFDEYLKKRQQRTND